MMTGRDEENIEYVLSLGSGEVADWIADMDEDELCYALTIIECAHWKLLDESIVYQQDCNRAKKVLEKIFYKD